MVQAVHSDSGNKTRLKENIKNIPAILGFFLIVGDVFSIILS